MLLRKQNLTEWSDWFRFLGSLCNHLPQVLPPLKTPVKSKLWGRMCGLGKLLTSLPQEKPKVFHEYLKDTIEKASMEWLAVADKCKLKLSLSPTNYTKE